MKNIHFAEIKFGFWSNQFLIMVVKANNAIVWPGRPIAEYIFRPQHNANESKDKIVATSSKFSLWSSNFHEIMSTSADFQTQVSHLKWRKLLESKNVHVFPSFGKNKIDDDY